MGGDPDDEDCNIDHRAGSCLAMLRSLIMDILTSEMRFPTGSVSFLILSSYS